MMSESIDRLIAEFKDLWIAEGLEEGREKGREQGMAEGRAEGLEEGRAESAREIARRMLAQGTLPREQVADLTGLPLVEIDRLASAD